MRVDLQLVTVDEVDLWPHACLIRYTMPLLVHLDMTTQRENHTTGL